MRHAWARLTRKQLLFAYPLALGIVNTAAFLAVYASLGGRVTFTAFAKANFDRWGFLGEHLDELPTRPAALLVAGAAAIAAVALAGAVRAPFFRAVAGSTYPLAPRSASEFLRLSALYAATGALFHLLPARIDPVSPGGQAVVFGLLGVAVLIIFADYALVFENLDPLTAVRRSIRLLRKGWPAAVFITLAAQLVYSGAYALFSGYFTNATTIFPLFAASQLLVEALIVLVLDVVLIFTYDHLRRS